MQENMDETIDFIVESMKSINRQALLLYKPIVEEICSGRTVEEKELEFMSYDICLNVPVTGKTAEIDCTGQNET